MDFTRKKYRGLIRSLKAGGYEPLTLTGYLRGGKPDKYVILRHDVDRLPYNSLAVARIEKEEGMKGSFYFRAVPESWDEDVIRKISAMGHEVGYHYESLATCGGDVDAAYEDFLKNLRRLREIVPVTTICMHGSPRSPYDSRDIWKSRSYRDSGIEGEPYFDVDFSDVFYLTDTGRRWDGFKVSLRDRVEGFQDRWRDRGLVFHSTGDILSALSDGRLPRHVMINSHPQRWTDSLVPWLNECLVQNAKNVVKGFMVSRRQNRLPR